MHRRLAVYLSVVLAAAAAAAACGPPAGDAQVAADADALLEVRVVTSGGLAAAYDQLAPRFQDAAGISLVTAYGASGGGASDSIPARLERREPFDVLIMSQAGLLALIDRGLVQADTRVDLATSGIGVAVREGAPLPDVSTPEAFARALLAAESIGYSASVSGTYLSTELLPRIGLWEQLEPKSRRIESERVAAVVARGEVEIGFQQVSEILSIEGAAFAGPVPAAYQLVTTFSAGIMTQARNPAGAQRLIDFLSSTEAVATVAESGLEPLVGLD